jgi:HEAT repeat protein
MQIAVSKLVKLLAEEQPSEVRTSAMTILSELGGRDAEISSAVVDALSDEDPEVRIRAIRAAGRLHVEKALPKLAERIRGGGIEAELAAEAAAGMGKKGTATLRELMGHVAPGLRRYIAASLARAGAIDDGEIDDLLTNDETAVVDSAVSALVAVIPTLNDKQRKRLSDVLLKVGGKKAKLSAASEAGVMRLAGLLDDKRAAPLLWDRVLPPHPTDARVNALQALGKWVTKPSKDELDILFRCAGEPDFRIVAPALTILDRLPVNEKLAADWKKLLRAPDIATRRVAMNKIGGRDDKEVIGALLDQVRHPDQNYRRDVFEHLGKTERGREALGAMLKEAPTSDEAWTLAKVLVPFAQKSPKAWMNELFPVASTYVEKGDQRANAVLFVLRESDNPGLRDRLDKRAAALAKKKDYETANQIYLLLARDPAIGFPIRLAIATNGLVVSKKALDETSRTRDPALHHFGIVAVDEQAKVLAHLKKAQVDADDLYYLGFHFAESTGALRDFGAAVLELLLKRFPRSKATPSAKNKLKSSK